VASDGYICKSGQYHPGLISDIWALWCSALSAKVPEFQKLKCRLNLDGKCNQLTHLSFKRLSLGWLFFVHYWCWFWSGKWPASL